MLRKLFLIFSILFLFEIGFSAVVNISSCGVELNESYPSIGRKFRGKDHTTAIYACEKIKKQVENNENILTEINLIKQRIYSEF